MGALGGFKGAGRPHLRRPALPEPPLRHPAPRSQPGRPRAQRTGPLFFQQPHLTIITGKHFTAFQRLSLAHCSLSLNKSRRKKPASFQSKYGASVSYFWVLCKLFTNKLLDRISALDVDKNQRRINDLEKETARLKVLQEQHRLEMEARSRKAEALSLVRDAELRAQVVELRAEVKQLRKRW